jgi:hypothetical protein
MHEILQKKLVGRLLGQFFGVIGRFSQKIWSPRIQSRVARWFVFKPKNPTWVDFGDFGGF